MTSRMTCDRCTQSHLCLNHEQEAKSRQFLREKDHREALARGKARRLKALSDAAIPTQGREC